MGFVLFYLCVSFYFLLMAILIDLGRMNSGKHTFNVIIHINLAMMWSLSNISAVQIRGSKFLAHVHFASFLDFGPPRYCFSG
jgi:hypothetical protein